MKRVWLILCDGDLTSGVFTNKKDAKDVARRCNDPPFNGYRYTVEGPYVLVKGTEKR